MIRAGRVDVVIVNWNSGGLLAACLGSLAEVADIARIASVVVVDNGSTDGSANLSVPELPLDIILAGRNLGFGKACNLGAARGLAEYVLFLNPDTEVESGTLDRVVNFLNDPVHQHVGVVGIRLDDRAGTAQRHCARFPGVATFVSESLGLSHLLPSRFPAMLMHDFDHLVTREVDHVMGAFYMVRRRVFEQVRGFDEDYFVYYEDLDLSRRIRNAGMDIRYLAEARAYHRQGGTSENIKARRLYYSLSGKLTYASKHLSAPGVAVVWAATLLAEPLVRLSYAVLRRSVADVAATVKGIAMLYRSLPTRARVKVSRA